MSAAAITPVILTKDEEANIGRTLESLRWAERVVVVDSGSKDRTEAIAATYANVDVVHHVWTTHAAQWEFGLFGTEISTAWLLALDADMVVPAPLVEELLALVLRSDIDGAVVGFRYLVEGEPLLSSLYPPQLRLLRRARARVVQRGHTHEFRVDGAVAHCRGRLVHDDRKPFERFVTAQLGYSARERDMLLGEARSLALRDALRLHCPFLPELVGMAAYLRAGGPFRGPAARRYGIERMLFEAMLRYRILEARQAAARDGSR